MLPHQKIYQSSVPRNRSKGLGSRGPRKHSKLPLLTSQAPYASRSRDEPLLVSTTIDKLSADSCSGPSLRLSSCCPGEISTIPLTAFLGLLVVEVVGSVLRYIPGRSNPTTRLVNRVEWYPCSSEWEEVESGSVPPRQPVWYAFGIAHGECGVDGAGLYCLEGRPLFLGGKLGQSHAMWPCSRHR